MNTQRIYRKTNTSHYARCRTLMIRFKRMQIIRLIILGIIIFSNCYYHVITLPFFNYTDTDPARGLIIGMAAYAVNIALVLLAFFTRTEQLRRLIAFLILIVISSFISFLHPMAGTAIFILYLTQLPECMRMRWIQQQQGYPYFNERYQLHEDYKNFTAQYIDDIDNPQSQKRQDDFPEIVAFSMPERKNRKS